MKSVTRLRFAHHFFQQKRPFSRTFAPNKEVNDKFIAGSIVRGYRVEEVRKVEELDLVAVRLTHEKTGAAHFHIQKDDPNCVFSVAFKTAPSDSTGVPHILEHTTLCGSKLYPVRDPFFKMLNRSMATYMNAWTAADWTMYPFSSVNKTDLENLRSVYMDATLFPLLKKADFSQEGWRLEHQEVSDPKSPIVFKGVVYNEMKGAFSDTGSLFSTRLQQHLHPGTTYSVVSGGDPKAIPDLTHEQLVEFHRKHYHPSNAMFFTYGDYPLESHLEYVDSILSGFGKIEPSSVMMLPPKLEGPLRISETCPPDPLGDINSQVRFCLAYQMNNTTDPYETFVGRLLSYLLMNGQASPFYKALIESKLGSQFSPGAGYDDSTQLATFSIGLQGMREENVGEVEAKIQQVFEEIAETGFEKGRIEGALHQIELGMKHRSSNFGLSLIQGIVTTWSHSGNPFENLEINKIIRRFRSDLDVNPMFFQQLVEKYFLDEGNKLAFLMRPDPDYNLKMEEEESMKLKEKVEKLGEEERQQVFQDGIELAELQSPNRNADASCLPCLKVEDVPKIGKKHLLEFSTVKSEFPAQWRLTNTNEMVYLRNIVSYQNIQEDLKLYLPLFTSCLGSLGTSSKSAAEFDEEVRRYTGGLGSSVVLSPFHSDLDAIQNGISFSSSSLSRNQDHMHDLLAEAINDTNYRDFDKLKTIILQNASSMMNSLADGGHVYARKIASSGLTPAQTLSELFGGLTQVEFMNSISRRENIEEVVENLLRIAQFLRSEGKLRIAVNLSQSDKAENLLERFISRTGFSPLKQTDDLSIFRRETFEEEIGRNVWIKTPFSTNFAARCIRTVPYTHEDSASLKLLSTILTHKYLHSVIREQNGAYGGGASYSPIDGVFSFYSYRDPNPGVSLESFEDSARWAAIDLNIDQQAVREAKLSLFGQLDAPVSPSSEGISFFESRLSADLRQEFRDKLFNVEVEDLRRVAEEYLIEPRAANQAVIAADRTLEPTTENWSIKNLSSNSK